MNKLKIAMLVFALALTTLLGSMSFADGTDPMPLCRPSTTRQCPPIIPPA